MESVEELEQDIESLTRELTILSQKRNELKAEKFKKECSVLSNHPVVREFESLFAKFPKLYEVLARENRDNKVTETGDSNQLSPVAERSRLRSADGTTAERKIFDKSISSWVGSPPVKVRRKEVENQKDLELKVAIENAYRLFGITFFPLVDPSDINFERNDVTRKMLGIRLEVFNERKGQFEKPHYILLKQRFKSNSWSLFKYTIPTFIDLDPIFQKIDNGIITTYDQVYLFAKQVYVQLLNISQRTQSLQELQEMGLILNLEIDFQISVISFEIEGMKKVRLFLQDDQVISCDIAEDDDLQMLLLGPISELKMKLVEYFANSTIVGN